MTRLVAGRRLASTCSLLLVMMVVSNGTAADTPLGQTGPTGAHHLRDSRQTPGAVCVYRPATLLLGRITVRPPVIYARNVTGARDHQTVGWRYRIQYWDVNGGWFLYEQGPVQTATAWDNAAATFSSISLTSEFSAMAGRYRVLVTMLWYRHGAIEGRATSRVDYYRWKVADTGTTHGPGGRCPTQAPTGA